MNNVNTKEELTEMLFKLIEDIGHTEDLIYEIKQETQHIKESIQNDITDSKQILLMQEELERQAKIIDKFSDNNIQEKLDSIENEINNIKESKSNLFASNTSEMANINNPNAQKIIMQKDITKWQILIIGILITFSILSVAFFIFIREITLIILIMYIVFCLPFCIAMYYINNNLKNLIANKKIIPIKEQ